MKGRIRKPYRKPEEGGNLAEKILAAVFWLLLWQGISFLIPNRVLFAGPLETVQALLRLAATGDFWANIAASLGRILGGFFAGAVLGIVLAFVSYHRRVPALLLRPFVTAVKSVPVASFTIMLLIWFGSKALGFFVSLLVVFPILYLNVYEGLVHQDRGLAEMAEVFRVPLGARLRYIELPGIRAALLGGIEVAIGMAFKSGVAAEVIGQPLRSIGNSLYQSKIYLETAELFAWTAVIIALSFVCEKLLVCLAGMLLGRRTK